MGARLSILPCQRARVGRTRHLGQRYLTRTIRPKLIDSAVMVSQVDAVESLVPAAVSLAPSASSSSTLTIIALLMPATLSQSMLPSQALRVLILKVRHIWAPTIQQTCAKTTLVIAESRVWEQRLGAPPTPLPFRQVRTLSSWSTRPGQLRRRRSSVARFPASSTIRRDLACARRGKCLKTKIEPHSVGAFYPLHRKRESQVGGAD